MNMNLRIGIDWVGGDELALGKAWKIKIVFVL